MNTIYPEASTDKISNFKEMWRDKAKEKTNVWLKSHVQLAFWQLYLLHCCLFLALKNKTKKTIQIEKALKIDFLIT